MHVQSQSSMYRAASGRRWHENGTGDGGPPTANETVNPATTGDGRSSMHDCATWVVEISSHTKVVIGIPAVPSAVVFQKYGYQSFSVVF